SMQSFAFTGGLGNFSLMNGEQTAPFSVTPGTYTVTETVPAGWTLSNVTCSNSQTLNPVNNSVSITVGAGQTITCIFNNVQGTGSVIIRKETSPATDQIFNFSVTPPLG